MHANLDSRPGEVAERIRTLHRIAGKSDLKSAERRILTMWSQPKPPETAKFHLCTATAITGNTVYVSVDADLNEAELHGATAEYAYFDYSDSSLCRENILYFGLARQGTLTPWSSQDILSAAHFHQIVFKSALWDNPIRIGTLSAYLRAQHNRHTAASALMPQKWPFRLKHS